MVEGLSFLLLKGKMEKRGSCVLWIGKGEERNINVVLKTNLVIRHRKPLTLPDISTFLV